MAQVRSPLRLRSRLSILLAVLAVVAAACGGGDDAATTTTATPATTTPQTTAAPVTTTAPTPTTSTTSAGSDIPATTTISVVQFDLTFLGYYEGPIDGIAGEETQDAISAFQKDAGIDVDGEYGPQTDAAMAEALESDEEYVADLQEFLIKEGHYSGDVDGDYGTGTQKAVKAFQKDCEIEETGLLDIETRLCRVDL